MNIGFYAGSFSPFTNGHLHVVKEASKLFDNVIIGIGINLRKTPRYEDRLMKEAIEKVLKREELNNVEVIIYKNLSVDAALEKNATFLIRGIRNTMDYEYEEKMALINEEISGLDTIYIRAGEFGNVSSTLVEELLEYGRDVSKFLPLEILELVKNYH
ncbi:MAG: pantetheine-phosphate adenylyltransferase [Clostridia bacterium]|nr:pantetheine-phosphate adenylyltransferase [Clostridia bacterium]